MDFDSTIKFITRNAWQHPAINLLVVNKDGLWKKMLSILLFILL